MSRELDDIIARLPDVTDKEIEALIARQRELLGSGVKPSRVDEKVITEMAIKDLKEVFKAPAQPTFKRRF